jgi:hypothetical protein
MLTPRRQALALAGVLAATTITGGALVTRLASHPPTTPPAVHATTVYASPAPAVVPAQPWNENVSERNDS